MWVTHIFHSLSKAYVREDNVIHCVADLQVKKTKAVNISEYYGCLTVGREHKF